MAMIALRVLGKKGRTTIPYAIRTALDFRPGDLISFTVNEDDSITVKQEFLCESESCPIGDDPDLPTPNVESILEDFSGLSATEQYRVMSTLISAWAGNLKKD